MIKYKYETLDKKIRTSFASSNLVKGKYARHNKHRISHTSHLLIHADRRRKRGIEADKDVTEHTMQTQKIYGYIYIYIYLYYARYECDLYIYI